MRPARWRRLLVDWDAVIAFAALAFMLGIFAGVVLAIGVRLSVVLR